MKNDFQRVEARRTILVAVMGASPAVLTETVWALAHQEQPVVPDEIVVITTKSGKEPLRTAIMSETPSVWERLKAALRKEKIAIDSKLVFGDTSIRVMPATSRIPHHGQLLVIDLPKPVPTDDVCLFQPKCAAGMASAENGPRLAQTGKSLE